MTKIDFYILAENSQRNIDYLTCQLTEKAYMQNNFVCIQSQSAEQANNLDELLWKYKAESFLPHYHHLDHAPKVELSSTIKEKYDYPILINSNQTIPTNYNPKNLNEVLINLSTKTPDFFSQFHRLAEIVDKDENSKQLARQRFRFYKDRGYEINTHQM
jgi:DNA polymerase-3 subunit chi